ncbi:PP2C family serine/threonine-protein phosphatase [Priestia endophytica]|uniref:PP2C family serine/threonine-protein phosphatase n=1 Tax=Priestia endophytica TaxID=135735 RepID=UPI0015585A18|nr:PP2C family serine/threonine-protein phosphatase [Priestia endophytica]
MKLDTVFLCSPSKTVSEDAYVINEKQNIYGVFDGATPVTPFQNSKGQNGAYLASRCFQAYFTEEVRQEESLLESVVKANKKLLEMMKSHHISVHKKEELWSTCVALIKLEKEKIQFAQLGDSMIVMENKEGKVTVLTKDTVKGIGSRAKQKREMERLRGKEKHDEDFYKKNLLYSLRYNRTLANTPNGYSVANGKEEVRKYIQYGEIQKNEVSCLLLVSDGFFHPSESLETTYQHIRSGGLERYAHKLAKLECENNLHSDDKTGILLQF